MTFVQPKIPRLRLWLAAISILVAVTVLNFAGRPVPVAEYVKMVAAAKCASVCQAVLWNEQGDPSRRREDPNETGIIGIEYSPITTTPGDLAAKRTSTQPDFAALLVRWFSQLELQKGTVVAVGCSGSFPALTLAAVCAASVLELKPVIISSIGASSYGANQPEWTLLDQERVLFTHGLIDQRSQAASLGGTGDVAAGLTPAGRQLLRQAIARNKIPLLHQPETAHNLAHRTQIYFAQGRPGVFVNIGGAQINVGSYSAEKLLNPGLNFPAGAADRTAKSMAGYFLQQGIPVIHLLHVETLALQNALPIDPQPFPEPGTTAIYYQYRVAPGWLLVAVLSFLIGVLSLVYASVFSWHAPLFILKKKFVMKK